MNRSSIDIVETHPSFVRQYAGTAVLLVSFALIPWTLYLAYSLPERHRVAHWDAIWVGFDVALAVVLLVTAVAALRGWRWLSIPATAAGTLLVCDAWFDILTAHGGHQVAVSVAEAVFVELPIAAVCFWMAWCVERVLVRRAHGVGVLRREGRSVRTSRE
jgi:hypothetical protein